MTAEAHPGPPRWPARSPGGVRAALAGRDREEFERDYRAALDRAGSDFDLGPVHEVVERWCQVAVAAADRPAQQRMLAAVDALRAGRPVPSTPWRQARGELGL